MFLAELSTGDLLQLNSLHSGFFVAELFTR